MSEPRPLVGIVIAHGTLAEGLVDAVRQISGADSEVLVPLSNRGLSPEAISNAVESAAAGRPAIVFTDMIGGSCTYAARRFALARPDIIVVGGVNLPMLLDFVLHRDLPPAELVERLLTRGRPSVCYAPAGVERGGEATGGRPADESGTGPSRPGGA